MIKNFNVNKNSTQSGRSMIEMLGVLAIVGVLSVGGIAGYSKAMTKFKINKTIDQVTHIATNIRTLYAQQTSYEGLNGNEDGFKNIISMGILPDSLTTSNSYPYITNVFQGGVYISSHWSHKEFTIVYNGLPKEACITLATYDWGSKHSSGLLAISASGEFGTSGPINVGNGGLECNDDWHSLYACPGDANNPTPMNVTRAAQACTCNDNTCTVGWKFQ